MRDECLLAVSRTVSEALAAPSSCWPRFGELWEKATLASMALLTVLDGWARKALMFVFVFVRRTGRSSEASVDEESESELRERGREG